MSTYSWDITVRRWNTYGNQVTSRTPTTVIAATKSEVTEKVRAMFEVQYDSFRKFWSHDWVLNSVTETTTPIPSPDQLPAPIIFRNSDQENL
jgi:hypothetical protein